MVTPIEKSRQAEIRRYYWSLVTHSGVAPRLPLNQVRYAFDLDVEAMSPRMSARIGPQFCILISEDTADRLERYLAAPSTYRGQSITHGDVGDAHLSIVHETLHCCGPDISYPRSGLLGLDCNGLARNLEELVTEMAARHIVARDVEISIGDIYAAGYEQLIFPTVRAIRAAVDCTTTEARWRLGEAALAVKRDLHGKMREIDVLGFLMEHATEARPLAAPRWTKQATDVLCSLAA